ncbi:MAG: type II toxin-antitoxin system Phd/YefM family antitoxin [Coriobacteriia bacterium]|nr:type II toxin-antitoxin system Phd/YefM family antitoxin [Coriobacteriia bacterium]MCL2537090.1 type II toxin-antitoxin system Phd/YefM family antitoxin [Coriobacteriia bacterium]
MMPMPDIIPVSELRQDATNVLKRAEASQNPVFVTQHGRASGVLMSARQYERTMDELGILKMLALGKREIVQGVGYSLSEVEASLDEILSDYE